MYKISNSATKAAASAANELCTDTGFASVTKNESVQKEPLYCRISTQKAIYKIPYQEILFIESEHKKSVIHLSDDTICVPIPLYRILEALPEESFVQTHRSFIVNLKNAATIDKSQNPWAISFFGSEQLAFVGRSFKKNLMQIVCSTLDFHTGK